MHMTFRPLRWTGPVTPDAARRHRPFRSTYADTLVELDYELDKLAARDVVIEADFREGDIRLDGLPRGNARQPSFPGIVLAFDSRHGPLQYASDSCTHWHDNLRCIALGLNALRAVDRFGITRKAQQYDGFKALPEAPTEGAPMTLLNALGTVQRLSQWNRTLMGNADDVGPALKRARRFAHPDVAGGSRDAWAELEQAEQVLRAAGRL